MGDPPVSIENRRFEVDQNQDLTEVAAMFAKSFGYTAELEVDPALAQLLRLRVSQINNCTYCMNLHYEAARDLGIPRSLVTFVNTGTPGSPELAQPRPWAISEIPRLATATRAVILWDTPPP